jgi:hypothetical protein
MNTYSTWKMEREQFKEAMAEALDRSLKESMMASDRLSWVDRPGSVAELDRWLETAQATVANLLRERRRAIQQEASR